MSDDKESLDKYNRQIRVKLAIVGVLVVAIGITLYSKQRQAAPNAAPKTPPSASTTPVAEAQPASVASAQTTAESPEPAPKMEAVASSVEPKTLPKLVDLGAGKCVPCKMMAPILEELKKEYAGRFDVLFIDVWQNPGVSEQYGINVIPTQIFYDAAGKELFRHEGFFSREDILAKWKELGVELSPSAPLSAPEPAFSRLEPVTPDARAKETICYMCDGDINPKTRTVLKAEKGEVAFCSPHCYFITYSSMPENKPAVESVSVTDWSSGALVPAASAKYLCGVDSRNRPTIKAFGDPAAASSEQQTAGGNTVEWAALQEKELATSCGFCDRAVYPEDACGVKVEGGLSTWGCCTMCALGVAARLQKDIEVTAKDALSGDKITVKTMGGHVASLEPPSSVAWAGTRKDAEGKLVSTGCFKQAFFVNEDNLRKWVEAHPAATGRMIPIEQALIEKMKLTPQQISKACKIGECTPK